MVTSYRKHLICRSNQLIGFCMMISLGLNGWALFKDMFGFTKWMHFISSSSSVQKNCFIINYFWHQGFFQSVWFTTVYWMNIEFSINLVQSHPKPTTKWSLNFSSQREESMNQVRWLSCPCGDQKKWKYRRLK